MDLNRKRCKHH